MAVVAVNRSISTAIKNPFTGQTFPGNVIPQSMLSPVSLNLLQYYPAANGSGTSSNLATTSSNNDNIDQFLGRVDQNIGNKVRLYVPYNWHDSLNTSIGAIPATGVTQPRVNKNTLFTYTHTLKPTLFNDFRIGYHRLDFDTLNQFSVNDLQGAGTALGIPGSMATPSTTTRGFQASPRRRPGTSSRQRTAGRIHD